MCGYKWDKDIEVVNHFNWDDIINLPKIRKEMEEKDFVEVVIDNRSCILITKDNIMYNDNVDLLHIHDDVLFIKIKKAV